jgi:mannose-6-phosphate isomerase-like protein (cupin superfamily)
VFYVVEGSATLVVGGTVVEPQSASADEVRGKAITGGETHQLKSGDVVVIPPGTPHQFTKVHGPFHYFVVKPISPSATPIASR